MFYVFSDVLKKLLTFVLNLIRFLQKLVGPLTLSLP